MDKCDNCQMPMQCVTLDEVKRSTRTGVSFALLFVVTIASVSVVEKSVTVRPADVLEQLRQSEQNVQNKLDNLAALIRDYEKTNRQKHPEPDATAERDTGRTGETKRPE